ncbi:MAG TPA: GNAT family N-acetyltransferase [Solirubrobacterales bacterium]|nr:GNAT family N-acetyltransferase [Solirubrobacterales bacterium]
MSIALSWRAVATPQELGELRRQWDELAVAVEQPFAAPAWALAWWEQLRPEGAELRIVAVHEGEQLVGIAPMHLTGGALRPLGKGVAAAEPIAAPGREAEVAPLLAAGLAAASPSSVWLETAASSPQWAGLLTASWPKGARSWEVSSEPLPRVDLGGGYEAWLKGKSGSFRRENKRKHKKLAEAGGEFRFADAETLADDVSAFMRLHRARLAGQGGSSLTDAGVDRMLVEVGGELLASGRFRLLCMEVEGQVVAGQVLLAAGRELSAWNSGFDEAYAKFSPSMQCLIHALKDGSERGESRMSLGPGAQDYKYRLSDSEDNAVTHALLPRGGGYPLARARLASTQLRKRLAQELRSRRAS